MGMKIALLGAESTGKSQLAKDLTNHLKKHAFSATQVPEYLREWCELQGRTPYPHEQSFIAHEQAARVGSATADIVIADTTPLMTAIYSHKLFADLSLYDFALTHQSTYDLTLVTALDLPWVADGLQRDGPHVREPIDALLRAALQRANIPYQVVYGQGIDRLQNVIIAINSIAKSRIPDCRKKQKTSSNSLRNWTCEKCSDPDCEHALFSQLVKKPSA